MLSARTEWPVTSRESYADATRSSAET